MRVNGGHISIDRNPSDQSLVLVVTEISGDIPSGSRTATVILTRDCMAEFLTHADQLFRRL